MWNGTARRRTGKALGALLLLLLAACGYHPHGLGSLPLEFHTVHVAALSNETFRPGLEGLVNAAIRRRLQQDGRIRVSDPGVAEAVLGGRLTAYQNDAIAFDRSDIGRRFRVRVRLATRLTRRGGGEPILHEEVVGEAFYTVGVGVVATQAAEEEATVRAANHLAERLVTRLLEGF